MTRRDRQEGLVHREAVCSASGEDPHTQQLGSLPWQAAPWPRHVHLPRVCSSPQKSSRLGRLFWLHPQPVEGPVPGIEPATAVTLATADTMPYLNPLSHTGTQAVAFEGPFKKKFNISAFSGK